MISKYKFLHQQCKATWCHHHFIYVIIMLGFHLTFRNQQIQLLVAFAEDPPGISP